MPGRTRWASAIFLLLFAASLTASERPNIIVMVADDLGLE